MATIMRLLVDTVDPRVTISAVPTYLDANVALRLWTGVRGMAMSTAAILLGRTDVVHVHISHGGSVLRKALPLIAARIRGVPSVVHAHSFDFFGWFGALPAPLRGLVRSALHTDHWLVLGTELAEQYRQRLATADAPVQVLHNPVAIPPAASSRPASPSPLNVVSLGRLGHRKGTYDLIQAISLLPADIRDRLHVTLAGDGDVEKARELVKACGLDESIDVIGWIGPDERDELLDHTDVFALPSYHEGLPMAILEAMARGAVPLTTPVGGIPDAVTDGVDAILVPPGRPGELAEALYRLTVDDALRHRLSSGARTRAAAFDVAQWRTTLADLWLSLADRHHD